MSFACQRCSQPIKLDESMANLSTYNVQFMIENVIKDEPSAQAMPGLLPQSRKRVVVPDRSHDQSARLLDQLAETSKSAADHLMASKILFESLSRGGEVDHPLCDECANTLVASLEARIREQVQENESIQSFIQAFEEEVTTESDVTDEELAAEIQALEREEAQLMLTIQNIDEDHHKMQREVEHERNEAKALAAEEEQYWKEYNEYLVQLEGFYEEQHSVERKYQHALSQLDTLKKTNVFNDAFHIWHSGHFGTINGFRFGRLATVSVEWSEINAAWGQTVLLLHLMLQKRAFVLDRFRLVPNGSQSRVEKLDDDSRELPLFATGGFKLFGESKFNEAMVAFLDCLQQFQDYVEEQDPHFKLPYIIDGDKIGDKSGKITIKYTSGHEEPWTKALKYVLTNLKWCLAWVCKQSL